MPGCCEARPPFGEVNDDDDDDDDPEPKACCAASAARCPLYCFASASEKGLIRAYTWMVCFKDCTVDKSCALSCLCERSLWASLASRATTAAASAVLTNCFKAVGSSAPALSSPPPPPPPPDNSLASAAPAFSFPATALRSRADDDKGFAPLPTNNSDDDARLLSLPPPLLLLLPATPAPPAAERDDAVSAVLVGWLSGPPLAAAAAFI
mmetsp:Transcript_39155/g.77195  ORF Transcript_39155/g.77195 Transcript_39155/m.77195 type:complete len:209 (+) Transcript_39155:155-781(+)